jgi:hypothetical protein
VHISNQCLKAGTERVIAHPYFTFEGKKMNSPRTNPSAFEKELKEIQGGVPCKNQEPPSNHRGSSSGNQNRTVHLSAAQAGGGTSSRETMGWVVIRSGPFSGEDYRLVRGDNVLGCAIDVQIPLTDRSVSTRHAVITCNDDFFEIRDLGSTNGTFVNQRKTVQTILVDNDEIKLGALELKFKCV